VSGPLPAASERVVAAGTALGIAVEPMLFPEGTKTSQDAAQAIGCAVSEIVKSLVFMVDDEPVLALLRGDQRLHPERLAVAVGGGVARRATLDEAREATGFAPGGTPPFGHTRPITVIVDEGLRQHEMFWAAAGTPTTVFPLGLDDLVRASGARWETIAERP